MAALTLVAELAQVNVILAMAGPAICRQLYFARGSSMAIGAVQSGMRTRQWEVRLLAVIELPD
jgi:hypothetical protein